MQREELLKAIEDKERIDEMHHYDYTVNVSWVMAHYNTAMNLDGKEDGTGGSHWQKYLHPKYQKRIFFPFLWSAEEIENLGK